MSSAVSEPSSCTRTLPPSSPSSPLVAPVNQNDMRICKKCRRVQLPAGEPFKTCLSCREKRRIVRRAAARIALASLNIPNSDNLPTSDAGKRKEREEEEDMSERLDRMKKNMGKHFEKKVFQSHTSHEPSDSNCITYQTATDMYNALRSNHSFSTIQFHGSFSIVAVAKITHKHREQLVVEELRKIVKWSFEHKNLMGEVKRLDMREEASLVVSESYNCTCHNSLPAGQATLSSIGPYSLLNATGAPASLKHRQSDLMTWVGQPEKSSASPSGSSGTECKGKVRISVEEDNSHPVKGIKGQKITVRITH